jgi:ABC-2 type transport system permease protein
VSATAATATTTTTTPTTPGLDATLASEWRKVRALRSTTIGMVLILLAGVGAGVFMTLIGDRSALADARAENEYSVLFYSSGLTTWAFAFLAASFVATEFHGMGSSTFAATPRRGRVLAVKLALVAACGLTAGLLASAMTAAATQGVLAARGFAPLDLTDPGLARAVVLLVGASMAVQGLLAACIAVLVRSAAGAVVITGLISLAPVSLAPFLGEWYSANVPRWLPGAAVESLAGVAAPGSYGYLDWPLATGCVIAWVTTLCAIAALRLPRMDIR